MKLFNKILVTVFAIAFVVIIPQSGIVNKIIPLPFSYCIPVLLFAWLFLKLYKENFSSIGFSFKRFEIKAVVIGTLTAIVLFIFLQYGFFPLLKKFIPLQPANLKNFDSIRHNTAAYIVMVALSWVVGGIYEEIIFHGFIFTRLEKLIAGKYAVTISFWLSNIVFALYHLQLGTSGVINAFIAGIVYHALMLHYKRNMWYAVFCHAVFDTIALTFIYFGYW
jgi:uncharacterized protein